MITVTLPTWMAVLVVISVLLSIVRGAVNLVEWWADRSVERRPGGNGED